MNKMDRMDRMLSQLPSEAPAEDLGRRVVRFVRARRRRKLLAHAAASAALAAGGLWLVSPLAVTLPGAVPLPGSGMEMTWTWSQAALTRFGDFLASVWGGVTGLQNGIAAPITASVWLGLAILGLSAFLAIGPLLGSNPGTPERMMR